MIDTNIDGRNHLQFPLLSSIVTVIGFGIKASYKESSSVLSSELSQQGVISEGQEHEGT